MFLAVFSLNNFCTLNINPLKDNDFFLKWSEGLLSEGENTKEIKSSLEWEGSQMGCHWGRLWSVFYGKLARELGKFLQFIFWPKFLPPPQHLS